MSHSFTLPLTPDPSLYCLDAEEATFLKKELRNSITDEGLKDHVISVQEKALAVAPFPCIHAFYFVKLKFAKMPVYQKVLRLGRERDNAIFLELGCCLGAETRKVVADGFPGKNAIAVDLYQDFLDLGHILFRSDPTTCPIQFLRGDILDDTFLPDHVPTYQPPAKAASPLREVTSLVPLRGHVSVIYIAAVFHLFDEPTQLRLARGVSSLLSPIPDSVICGWQIILPKKGKHLMFAGEMFCHSAASWTELWTEQVFKRGTVRVDCNVVPWKFEDKYDGHLLYWSVTRLASTAGAHL